MLAITRQRCETCDGTGIAGEFIFTNHDTGEHRGNQPIPCNTCHGKGLLYPAALVERIASVIVEHFLPDPNRKGIWTGRLDAAVAVLDALNDETP